MGKKTIEINKKELISKTANLNEDLADVAIVCEYLKTCTILTTKEFTDVMKNTTFDSDIYANLDESIDAVNRAVEIFDWLEELASAGENAEND